MHTAKNSRQRGLVAMAWSLLALCSSAALSGCGASSPSAAAPAADNTVVATSSPSSPVSGTLGSTQTISVSFNSSDGNSARNLQITTDLSSLPSGWSAAPVPFSCSRVDTGSGCLLNLTFAPTLLSSGTITLDYRYTSSAGVGKSGTFALDYQATANNNVIATTQPSGQISVITGAQQTVNVTFTTDDGNLATGLLLTSDLGTLPPGWSSRSNRFACATVSTGTNCRLSLNYAPLAIDRGSFRLNYTYTNNTGSNASGRLDIAYAATADNNVVSSVSPSGTITVTTGDAENVTVNFVTDDGNPATALSINTDLTALPPGWSATPAPFRCASVSTGNACQLALRYAPSAAASGTLALQYGYTNNTGIAKTGTVNIPYAAFAAAGAFISDYNGQKVSYCPFQADNTFGNCSDAANNLGNPTSLIFNGNTAYVANYISDSLWRCAATTNHQLSDCTAVGSGLSNITGLALSGVHLYATSRVSNHVLLCMIADDGSLQNCAATGSDFDGPTAIALAGTHAYVTNLNDSTLSLCAVGNDGSLSACTRTGDRFVSPYGVTLNGTQGYVMGLNGPPYVCAVAGDGSFGACTTTASNVTRPLQMQIRDNVAYISSDQGKVWTCTIQSDGSLNACIVANSTNTFLLPWGIAIR